MVKIAVLGAGMVGRAIALDLAKNFEVTSIDINDNSLNILQKKNPAIKTVQQDLGDHTNYPELLRPFDFVVTAVPGFMGFKTVEAVILSKKILLIFLSFQKMLWNLINLQKKII